MSAQIQLIDSDDEDSTYSSDAILSMLSPEARLALQSHLSTSTKPTSTPAASLAAAASSSSISPGTIASIDIGEDFGMSQFWYTPETSRLLAEEALTCGGTRSIDSNQPLHVAFISCPSAFRSFQLLAPSSTHPHIHSLLLEYDPRFSIYGSQFLHYDFNRPRVGISEQHHHRYDVVIADPPYLNAECMSLTGETMQLLAKRPTEVERSSGGGGTKLIFNTGIVLRPSILSVLGLRSCVVRPRHAVHLMNEFASFTNYESERLGGWEKEEEEERDQNRGK